MSANEEFGVRFLVSPQRLGHGVNEALRTLRYELGQLSRIFGFGAGIVAWALALARRWALGMPARDEILVELLDEHGFGAMVGGRKALRQS